MKWKSGISSLDILQFQKRLLVALAETPRNRERPLNASRFGYEQWTINRRNDNLTVQKALTSLYEAKLSNGSKAFRAKLQSSLARPGLPGSRTQIISFTTAGHSESLVSLVSLLAIANRNEEVPHRRTSTQDSGPWACRRMLTRRTRLQSHREGKDESRICRCGLQSGLVLGCLVETTSDYT